MSDENKKITLTEEDPNWKAKDEDNDADAEVENDAEEEVVDTVPKIVYPKDIRAKNEHGDIIIDKLGEYIEPAKAVKQSRAEDMVGGKDKFAGLIKAASDDEGEGESSKKVTDLSELLVDDTKTQTKKTKNQQKKNVDDGLDDLLGQFGVKVEIKVAEPVVKKEKKVVEKKEPKPVVEGEKPAEEKKETKKKVVTKAPATKSHLNDAKRLILEKQEELKKKQKKMGN